MLHQQKRGNHQAQVFLNLVCEKSDLPKDLYPNSQDVTDQKRRHPVKPQVNLGCNSNFSQNASNLEPHNHHYRDAISCDAPSDLVRKSCQHR